MLHAILFFYHSLVFCVRMLVSVLDKSVTDAYFINLVMCECKSSVFLPFTEKTLSFNQTKHSY